MQLLKINISAAIAGVLLVMAAFSAGAVNAPAIPALSKDAQKILALQICLDRRALSCNTLDGANGKKTEAALATWCALNGKPYIRGDEKNAWEKFFPGETNLFQKCVVTAADHAALVVIPTTPAEKAKLPAMGYMTILEMYAEKGHVSEKMLMRLNSKLSWPNPPVGSEIVIPDTLPVIGKRAINLKRPDGEADVLRISLSRLEITAFDKDGKLIGLFPCSIAANKNKLPQAGEIQVASIVPKPNYTHTEERAGANGRRQKYIYAPGANNPVGLSWIGLSLPTYGIHGTPFPERIGRAESHGCFRLANWNAVRLRKMCDVGTSVVIEN